MEADFWHRKWSANEIAFHQREANPLLVQHFKALDLAADSRVFLPLCGKTLDIPWLLSNGSRVAGAELSTIAVEQLFATLAVTPEVSRRGDVEHYHAENVDIFVGDIFHLTAEVLGPVDAIYDRAALVALPPSMRRQYSAHLKLLTETAPQLLICYEYDQSVIDGPPFSISHEEVRQHYGDSYGLSILASYEVAGGMKGRCAATEHVWLLEKEA